MSIYDNDDGCYLSLQGYPDTALVERYKRDSDRVSIKWQELDKISGDARCYFMGRDGGFWNKFFMLAEVESIAKGRNEQGRLLMCDAIVYFNRVEPKIDTWIKEAKHERDTKNNDNNTSKWASGWFSRILNRLFKKS